jgi:putative Holliday junction resolvase
VLAIDLGDVRLGLALSDETGRVAQPYGVLKREGRRLDLQRLARLAREIGVGRIVVGLPLRMDGTAGDQARRAQAFAERLRQITGLPVETWDERLSTAAATRSLLEANVGRTRRKGLVDQAAACLILQAYLDRRRSPGAP